MVATAAITDFVLPDQLLLCMKSVTGRRLCSVNGLGVALQTTPCSKADFGGFLPCQQQHVAALAAAAATLPAAAAAVQAAAATSQVVQLPEDLLLLLLPWFPPFNDRHSGEHTYDWSSAACPPTPLLLLLPLPVVLAVRGLDGFPV